MPDLNQKAWYLHDGQKQTGPHTLGEAKAIVSKRGAAADLQAWHEGLSDWQPVKNFPELQPNPPPSRSVSRAPSQTSSPPPKKPRPEEVSMMLAISKDSIHSEEKTALMNPAILKAAEKEAFQFLRKFKGHKNSSSSSPLWRIIKISILTLIISVAAWVLFSQWSPAHAEEPISDPIDVEKFKERYWTKGNKDSFNVLQNRLYTKEKKVEIGLLLGTVSTDPFLDVHNFGGLLSYHFSEYFAVNLLIWKYLVSSSSALTTLQQDTHDTAPTNNPASLIGLELAFSPLYGKLSLMGKAIIYLDTQITAGAARVATANGTYFAPVLGIGEQIYLNHYMTLRIDYRLAIYTETIKPTNSTNVPLGPATPANRTNFSNSATLGLSFLF